MAPMPLEGIRILDLTIWQVGAAATGILADLGADVIKIEDPVNGDPSRKLSFAKEPPGVVSLMEATSRNKRAMTLDLKSDEGRQVFYRMVRDADVVAENFRTGVAERLGLGHETLSKHNPRIILASASGMGRKGPDAQIGLFDIMGHARSGFMNLLADREAPMRYVGAHGLADQTGGIFFALGILAALTARNQHGIGQRVEVSQLAALMSLQSLPIQHYLLTGEIMDFPARHKTRNVLFNIYKGKDGKWLCLACPQSDRYWPDVCAVLDIPHLQKDPRFVEMKVRDAHSAELIPLLDAAFATRTRDEWVALFKAREVNCSPVQDYGDLRRDPQVIENGYLIEVEHPVVGRLTEVNVPIVMSKTPARFRNIAPQHGEHTELVLQEHGYSWEEIERLRDKGVI